MKIYLASSWKNQNAVLNLAGIFEKEGFEVDAFCRATDNRYSFHWSELVGTEDDLKNYDAIDMLTDPRTQRAFKEDKKWLDWSDCVILVLPCGRSSHMEAGYAKGQGKLLYIYGHMPKGEFDVMYGFADGLFRSEELLSLIVELKGKGNPLTKPEFEGLLKKAAQPLPKSGQEAKGTSEKPSSGDCSENHTH